MRIMSLNGWGGTRHASLLSYVAAEQPDILCLQEVVHTRSAPADWLTYRDGGHVLPQRARFFAEAAAALPNHTATFCPAAQGVLWDGDTAHPSQWGLATFLHRDLTVIGQHQGFVHKGFAPHGYGDHPRSRSAHAVRLHHCVGGRGLVVAHMHGLRDLDGKHDTPARATQAARFAALIGTLAEPGDSLVVCGDLNVLPGSETFDILGELGVTDLVTSRNHRGTRTSLYAKPQRFADYMMVSPDLSNARFDIIRSPEVSDHCPLVLTLP